MVASIAMAQQGYPVEINDIKSTPTEMLDRDEAMEPGEDSNNVKQDMSIDAYGRESAEETCATNVGSALRARLSLDVNLLQKQQQKQFCGTQVSSPGKNWGAVVTPSTTTSVALAGDWSSKFLDSVDDDSEDSLSDADFEESEPWVRPPILKNARLAKHQKSVLCQRGLSEEVLSLSSATGAAKAARQW